MVDPNANPNMAWQQNVQQPMSQAPVTPQPQNGTPATPGVPNPPAGNSTTLPGSNPPPTTQINISNGQQDQGKPQVAPPGTSLQPGAQSQDVQQLQNYLTQQGYLTPEQVATGPGTYGPQTTAAVAKMQKDLGLNPVTGSGSYGPQTQSALAQKYQGLFNAVKGTQTPDTSAAARAAIGGALDNAANASSNPVFGALSASMEPIMQSLTQVLNNINNPSLTTTSLQSEYNTLRDQYNLPAMNAQMMNLQNVMNGTIGDIRTEITTAGGLATESQVQGMAAARNVTIQKQYNALATQYSAAQTNVQAMMQYATQDQATQLQRSQATAQITESMASIQNQMLTMGMTMQNNAKEAVQYNVTQMGYQGLADSAKNNPQMLRYYENMLGLAPGTLSDPNAVARMDTYRNQQLQLNNYRAAIAAYSAGYGGGMIGGQGGSTAPGAQPIGQVGVNPVDSSTLTRPSWVTPNTKLSMSADEMNQLMDKQKAASVDPGTNNVVVPGIGYYLHQSDGSYVLQASLPSPTDTQYNQIKSTIAAAGPFSGSPRVTGQWTTATNKELSAFKGLGTYQVLSTVAPYMANIRAAQTNPGSISDLELLDSYVRLSKGGTGQVTGDQVDIALRGASIGDKASILEQKLQNGGVLSTNQRQQLITLASNVYNENSNDYKKLYVQATQGLQAQGIPVQFWRSLPDLNTLLAGNSVQQ